MNLPNFLTRIQQAASNFFKPKATIPDPDGHALARLLAEQGDPIQLIAPLGQGSVLAGPNIIGNPTAAQSASERRQQALESTTLAFVGQPASLKKLRDCGYIESTPAGDVFAYGSLRVPFFGYDTSAPMDNAHWGLELRRVDAGDWARKDRHAMREQDADLETVAHASQKKKNRL